MALVVAVMYRCRSGTTVLAEKAGHGATVDAVIVEYFAERKDQRCADKGHSKDAALCIDDVCVVRVSGRSARRCYPRARLPLG